MGGINELKRFFPKSLLGRSLLIVGTPVILLQVVAGIVFFDSHWSKVSRRLAVGLTGEIISFVRMLEVNEALPHREREKLVQDMARGMGVQISLKPDDILSTPKQGIPFASILVPLDRALSQRLRRPYRIKLDNENERVIVRVQLAEGVLEVNTSRKKLFSSTTYVFVLWMVGTSMILLAIAVLFMRNQVKPIRRLAAAADGFGKGRDTPEFKPEGAREVRQAGAAFQRMRDRIQRHVDQRTKLLAGVSHDLRTPITRMKLQLAMFENEKGVAELRQDVSDMEALIEGYLDFARGEGEEQPRPTALNEVMEDAVAMGRRKGGKIDLHIDGAYTLDLRPNAIKRALTNLIENAIRYADKVWIRVSGTKAGIEIIFDDDGPGVPKKERKNVFRPFYRVETSRNPHTGGVGLGLSIARDIVRAHGGDITLGKSPYGGLRATVFLPL